MNPAHGIHGRRAAALAGVLLAVASRTPAQGITAMPAPHQEVAPAAQEALRNVIASARRTKTLENLGLRSRAEADRATLGAAILVREIGYDKLLAWQPGMDPAAVFVGPPQVIYPVMVGSEPRSALTLVRKGAAWELTSYGDAERVASIFRAREALRGEADGAAEQTNLVVAPAFRIELVAETRGGRTLLRPVVPAAEAGITGTLEAGRAVELLAAYAREYDQKYGQDIRQRRLVH